MSWHIANFSKNLVDRARSVFKRESKETGQGPETEPIDSKAGDNEPADQAQEQGFFKKSVEQISKVREKTRESMNQAAEKTADVCSNLTGRKTTAKEVKKVAAIAGSIAAGIYACSVIGRATNAARRAKQIGNATGGIGGFSNGFGTASLGDDQHWENDAIEHDRQQYDQLRDHIDHDHQLNDVIDDQISYNQSFDY